MRTEDIVDIPANYGGLPAYFFWAAGAFLLFGVVVVYLIRRWQERR